MTSKQTSPIARGLAEAREAAPVEPEPQAEPAPAPRVLIVQNVESWMPGSRPVPDVLTLEEAAEYLRIPATDKRLIRGTLDPYRQSGMLPSFKLGNQVRFRRGDLIKFVEQLSRTGGSIGRTSS